MTESKVEYDAGTDSGVSSADLGGLVRVPEMPRYTQTPEWVLFHPDLTDAAIRLYGVLMRYGNRSFPSRGRLGEHMGKSERTVSRLLRELVDHRVLVIVPRHQGGQQLSNAYILAWLRPLRGDGQDQHAQPASDQGGDKNDNPGVVKNVQQNDSKNQEYSSGTQNTLATPENPEPKQKKPHQALFETVYEEWTGKEWVNGTHVPKTERGKINDAVRQLRQIDATPEDFRARAAEYRRQHPTWDFTPHAVMGNWSTLEPQSGWSDYPAPYYRPAEDVLAEERQKDAEDLANLEENWEATKARIREARQRDGTEPS